MAYNSDNLALIASGFGGAPRVYAYSAGADSLATVAADHYFDAELNNVVTGDKVVMSTTTANLSFSATFRNDGVHVYVDWDNTLFREAAMNDISTAETIYLPIVPKGVIVSVYGVQFAAVTVASSVITFSIGAAAITGGTLTITTAGVAGQTWSATPTALNVTDGATGIKIVTDGGSTTTARGVFGIKLVCGAQV